MCVNILRDTDIYFVDKKKEGKHLGIEYSVSQMQKNNLRAIYTKTVPKN